MSNAMSLPALPTGNALLDTLTQREFEILAPMLSPAVLQQGEVLLRPHAPINAVWFPTEGMVSFVLCMDDGAAIEVAVTGREGMVGGPVLLGGDLGSLEAIVQLPMLAWRMAAADLARVAGLNRDFDQALRRHLQALFLQVVQGCACNQHHSAAQRLARWLLMADDHARGAPIRISHEVLAVMLGVRRASVTDAIVDLRAAGIVSSANARIAILDRARLEQLVCECYRAIRDDRVRLSPFPPD